MIGRVEEMVKEGGKGFTLIELLAMISILGVIMAIGIYISLNVIGKAKNKSYLVTINNIENEAINYLNENGEKLFFVSNGNSKEYQCVTVENLVDMGYFDENITQAKVSNNETVELSDYIYLERNSDSKTVTKSVYLSGTSAINNVCSSTIEATGNIRFVVSPAGWSKTKEITIHYQVKNSIDASSYQNNYQYVSVTGKEESKKNVGNSTSLSVTENGEVYAEIDGLGVNASQVITKIDNISPVITHEYKGNKYISSSILIPIILTDNESGIDKDTFYKEKIKVTVGGKTIDDIEIVRKNDNKIELTINSKEDGEVIITILKDTVFDNVGNGNKETVIKPGIIFDKTAPTCTISGNPSSWTRSNVTLTVVGISNGGSPIVSSGYSWTSGTTELNTTNTLEISKNGKYTAHVKDMAGNAGSCSVTVTMIDRSVPTCTISANPSTWTNSNVTLTVSANDKGSGLPKNAYSWTSKTSGYGTVNTKSISANATYTAYVKDAVGNVGSCSVTVSNIDKTAPTCTISVSTSGVSISTSDTGGSKVNSYDLTTSSTATYNKNSSSSLSENTYYGYVKDNAGNTGKCGASVFKTDVSYTKSTWYCNRSSYSCNCDTCGGSCKTWGPYSNWKCTNTWTSSPYGDCHNSDADGCIDAGYKYSCRTRSCNEWNPTYSCNCKTCYNYYWEEEKTSIVSSCSDYTFKCNSSGYGYTYVSCSDPTYSCSSGTKINDNYCYVINE